jgi:hypothetical protein
MPIYVNRPSMDPVTELRRYICLSELEDMLRSRRLHLTRVDQFMDPFEGSVPQRQIDDQAAIFGGAHFIRMSMEAALAHHPGTERPLYPFHDPWQRVTTLRRAATRSAHASCWTAGPESEAMWRLYCEDGARGQGMALRSTLGRVEASVEPHGLYVSPVVYRLYHEGPAFTNDIDPFMHKRLGFECEREVRVLHYDQEHQLALAAALLGPEGYAPASSMPDELPVHTYLNDWKALEVADAITVSPYATDEYEQKVRATVTAINAEAVGRIELSVLSERRYAAHF